MYRTEKKKDILKRALTEEHSGKRQAKSNYSAMNCLENYINNDAAICPNLYMSIFGNCAQTVPFLKSGSIKFSFFQCFFSHKARKSGMHDLCSQQCVCGSHCCLNSDASFFLTATLMPKMDSTQTHSWHNKLTHKSPPPHMQTLSLCVCAVQVGPSGM